MNKLVIVGNGFDLAHKLPTSYKEFIDDFWKNLKNNYSDPLIKKMVTVNEKYPRIFEFDDDIVDLSTFKTSLQKYAAEYRYYFQGGNNIFLATGRTNQREVIFQFKSSFFLEINKKQQINNWVDIEKEYYRQLKASVEQKDKNSLLKLNKEFEAVKQLFEEYLVKGVLSNDDFILENSFCLNEFFTYDQGFIGKNNIERYIVEFSNLEDREDIKEQNSIGYSKMKDHVQNLFLNFNYTASLRFYIDEMIKSRDTALDMGLDSYFPKPLLVHIHGELNNKQNPINFGFGDENDADYAMIEDLDDNEYLKYFKSFQYLQNDNYDKMLRFIESGKFQVYIMGHSCGLSDRTLLSTIFEHENCRSIKPFFYEKEDGSDNYTELVQNISRHFSDKKVMRAKLVNKELCEPLPQTMRFTKKSNTK